MSALRMLLLLVLAALVSSEAAAQDPSALELAYQKEFAYLRAEKAGLESHLAELDESTARERAQARAEVDALQSRVIALQVEADRLTDTLSDLERRSDSALEANEAVTTTLIQARSSLEAPGFDLGPETTDIHEQGAQLIHAYATAAERVRQGRGVHTEQGSFFLTDGTKVEGHIVHLGNVAAFGVSEQGAGALAPAGQGHLRLWPEPAADTARALLAGDKPSTLRAFLYESTNKRVDDPEAWSPSDLIEEGGVIGVVILVLGALAMLMVVLRFFSLRRLAGKGEELLGAVAARVRLGQLTEAEAMCQRSHSAQGRVMLAVLRRLGQSREVVEDAAAQAILAEAPRIQRFGTAIPVIAAVAPLLGLLGTVTGMIATFDIITKFGTGDPGMLSSGISEALVTTQLGLVVAIPSLLLGNLLAARASALMESLDRSALELANIRVPGPRDGDGMEEPEVEDPPSEAGAEPSALEAVASHA